jgi:hypothetical protein
MHTCIHNQDRASQDQKRPDSTPSVGGTVVRGPRTGGGWSERMCDVDVEASLDVIDAL